MDLYYGRNSDFSGSFCAINKTGVTIKVSGVTEALEKTVFEVKDNNNNIVEVNAVPVIDQGETEVTFTFKTTLTAEPTGTWTVNGVAFDANAQAAVKAVNDAANQVELLTALKSSYFKGVEDKNIAQYDAEITPNTYTSVEEVQKAIDKANTAATGDLAYDAVKKATNQVELLAALQNAAFERVNSALIKEYAEYDTGAPGEDYKAVASVANVQTIIDAVNLQAAQDATTAADTTAATALTTDAISKAQDLVTALPEKTDAEKTTKAGLQTRIDTATAFSKVKNATTQASLLAALKAPILKLTKIDDASAKYYKQILDGTTTPVVAGIKATITSTGYNLQTLLVNAGNTAAIADYVAKIGKVTADTTTADLKALLTELKRLDGTVVTEKINDTLLEDYKTAIIAAAAVDKDSSGDINTLLQAQNSATAALTKVADSGNALTDGDKLLAALKDKRLVLDNLVDANKTAYFTDIALLKTAAGTDAATLKKAVAVINAVVDANKATTATDLRTALTNHSANLATPNTAYLNLSAQAKLEVAEIILKAKTADFANSAAVTTALGATAAAGALKTHDDKLNATGSINKLTADSSITELTTALDKIGYKKFTDLSVSDKLEVVEAFKAALPRKADDNSALALSYTTLAGVIADVDKAITVAGK